MRVTRYYSYITPTQIGERKMSAQIGTVSNFEINGDKLLAHGYEWAIKSVREYDHWGATRLMIKATKAKGRKIFNMVVYENNTISGAV